MNSNISIFDASFSYENDHIIIQREKGIFYISNVYNNVFDDVKTMILCPVNGDNEKSEKIFEIVKNLNDDSTLIRANLNSKSHVIETLDYVSAIVSAHNSGPYEENQKKNKNPWFINIILLINKDLKQNTLIKAYSKALESKIVALWDLDVRKPSWDLFTGNNDDELICACTGFNNEISDVDELQNLVGKCVRKAVGSAMLKSGFSKGIIDFIEGVGIKIDDLVKAGMELLVGVEESEELRLKLHQQILKSLEDLNVVSFIIAGIRLEEDYMKHRVEGINVDDDPAYLYSDEVFGMSIANQIAGTKAIFNFKRYDEKKPGIISGLGPVLDDVFAGLVAGCMSKIFED
ncbi:MAG: phosphatidylglycerophosphatase A [Methanobacterium sp.]